jgi:primosomal replication protein N''
MSEKICPSCGERRPASEVFCANDGWNLTDVPIAAGTVLHPQAPAAPTHRDACPNGHEARPGDLFCPICDAEISASAPMLGFGESPQAGYDPGTPQQGGEPNTIERRIGQWTIGVSVETPRSRTETWFASRRDGTTRTEALLVLFAPGVQIEENIANARRSLVPRLAAVIDSGVHEDRAFEVYDVRGRRPLQTLLVSDGETLRPLISALSSILADMARTGVRHRDLRPEAIVVGRDDLSDPTLVRLGNARLASHDLEVAAVSELTRYSAPEALTGAVTPASDWWSFGIILLELATGGTCFEGIEDHAFLMHVVARGVDIPATIAGELRVLLQGLLLKDRDERWQAAEVEAWMAGQPVALPAEPIPAKNASDTKADLSLRGKAYRNVATYALAAGRADAWNEARDHLVQGRLSGWLDGFTTGEALRAQVRNILRREDLDDDTKLSLALKQLNPDMPLVRSGEIVTPAWLLQHPETAYELVIGPAPEMLDKSGPEAWLLRLKRRAADVRRRIATQEIEVDEATLRVNLLAVSTHQLSKMWIEQRRRMPDSAHRGLSALMERPSLREDDLILLLSADKGQFLPIDEVVSSAAALAKREGISGFDHKSTSELLQRPRREVMDILDRRVSGFARCGHERVDQWIDQYRLERRIPLSRALVALTLSEDAWNKPARQDYVAQILSHFEKRIGTSVSRGALARMTVTKSSARIDMIELGTRRIRAATLLDHILERTDAAIDVDPAAFEGNEQLEPRLRRLARDADLQRRETGINGLYLGYPFVLMRAKSEDAKPRIAPLLLWPVAIQTEVGQRARLRLAFDRDREEVRLNPALQSMLAPDALEKWEVVRDQVLSGTARATAVIDEFRQLAGIKVRDAVLSPLPGPETKVAGADIQLTASAVLFHVTFVGQAIVGDIRSLQAIPPAETGLETLLRSNAEDRPRPEPVDAMPDADRYVTADSDPAQDRAVERARLGPGLVIEGPPGTGKSQTIVNLVSDAIGRKRSLLIVCQKQAALDVVHKRLEREGLGDRVVMVKDATKDRRAILESIRVQLDSIRSTRNAAPWLRQRTAVVDRIKKLEAQLTARHEAIHRSDDVSGKTYREILSDLIEIEEAGSSEDFPDVRRQMAAVSAEVADATADEIASVANVWREARFEDSPLQALKQFSADPVTMERASADLASFVAAERRRLETIDPLSLSIPVFDAAALGFWVTRNSHLMKLDSAVMGELGRLVGAFEPRGGQPPRAGDAASALQALSDDLDAVTAPGLDSKIADVLAATGEIELDGWRAVAADALAPRSWLSRLVGRGRASRGKIAQFLASVTPVVDDRIIGLFLDGVEHERMLRRQNARWSEIRQALGFKEGKRPRRTDLDTLRDEVAALRASLRRVEEIYNVLASSPCRSEAIAAARKGTTSAMVGLFDAVTRALTHEQARRTSLAQLDIVSEWLEPMATKRLRSAIENAASNKQELSHIIERLPTLEAFQRFRARAAQLSSLSFRVLAALRPTADRLNGLDVALLVRREARLAWKQRLEAQTAMLVADDAEVSSLVAALAAAETELKRINRDALAGNIEPNRLRDRASWNDITRYSGPRARRLREFLRDGAEIGLMELRPVWLMNPDIASRLLPLTKGLFDTIVYDEASQMPVEYALPTLYRARNVVVSGDEKQLPPTAFFAARSGSDDEADGDVFRDDLDEEQRNEAEEAWNRREIQDCPNLLDLSKVVLPSEQLQVHYRSQFRELISFSNAGFYAGSLSVPVRHPLAEVDVHRPLVVEHVGGRYEKRTNVAEAERIVAHLETLWLAGREPPTTGVVTFNRDQADLIEEHLERRAEANVGFRNAYVREAGRVVNGEDMSFFVKNVENVQGDERDHILFSTTFGRDAKGMFRRNFGALGQTGGERRLNVAVTRARQKITIFTSMPISDISDVLGKGEAPSRPRDYIQLYLAYADAVSRGEHDTAKMLLGQFGRKVGGRTRTAPLAGDGFLQSVARTIEDLGWRPVSAGDGSAFGIDLAIPHPVRSGFAIGIECDSADHPLLRRPFAREVWRASVMRRSIPAIHRISSRNWYHARTVEVARLRNAIQHALHEVPEARSVSETERGIQ